MRVIFRLCVFLLLAAAEAAIAYALPTARGIPLLTALGIAAVYHLPRRDALAFVLLAGFAREPWSTLPFPLVTLLTALPAALLIGVRTLRRTLSLPLFLGAAALCGGGIVLALAFLVDRPTTLSLIGRTLLFGLREVAILMVVTALCIRARFLWIPDRLPLVLTRKEDLGLRTLRGALSSRS